MNILGYRHSQFKADDGRQINGVTVYFSFPIEKDGAGTGFNKHWVKEDIWQQFLKDVSELDGSEDFFQLNVEPAFNQYRKVSRILIIN